MEIEPIHELIPEDLDYLLETTKIDFRAGLKAETNSALTAFAAAVKQSLIFFYPEFEGLLREINDANEAVYAASWAFFPLNLGIFALQKIYGVEETGDFSGMAEAVKNYAINARHYYLKPVVTAGRVRIRQLHKPKVKRDMRLLDIIRKQTPRYSSMQGLLRRFAPQTIDGYLYEKIEEDGETFIRRTAPDGKRQSFKLRTLSKNYWDKRRKLAR